MRLALALLLATLASWGTSAQDRAVLFEERYENTLDASDATLEDGSWFKTLDVSLAAGQRLEVRLTSTDFDPYLLVERPGSDERFANDDWDGSPTESRLVLDVSANSDWVVVANAEVPGEGGAFVLEVRILGPPEPAAPAADRGVEAFRARAAAVRAQGDADPRAAWPQALAIVQEAEAAFGEGSELDRLGLVTAVYVAVRLLLRSPEAFGDGDLRQTVRTLERAVPVYESVVTDRESLDLAAQLTRLGLGLRFALAKLDNDPAAMVATAQAEVDLVQAHAALEDPGEALLRLAEGHRAARSFDQAEAALDRAEATFLRDGQALKRARVALERGLLLEDLGRPAEARRAYEAALEQAEAVPGASDADLYPFRDALADLLRALGDTAQADRIAPSAEGVQLEGLARVQPLLDEAGRLEEAGDFTAAAERMAGVVAQVRADPTLPDGFTGVFQTQYGVLLWQAGDPRAAAETDAGLVLVEPHYGDSPELGRLLYVRAHIADSEGDLSAVESFLRRAIAAYRGSFGERHPDTAEARRYLGAARFLQGDTLGAIEEVMAASRALDAYGESVLPALSIAEQRAFLEATYRAATIDLIGMTIGAPEALPEAYGLFAGWKGLLLQGVARQAAVARLADDPRYAADVARLAALRRALAQDRDAQSLQALTDEKEALERRLAAGLPPDALVDPWTGTEGLAQALPAGTALADLYLGPQGVAAIVTGSGGAPALVRVGVRAEIEEALEQWRSAVLDGGAAVPEAERLRALLWAPIAEALPAGTQAVWVSPDGALARVPFAALARVPFAALARVPFAALARVPFAALAGGTDLVVLQTPSARSLMRTLGAPPSDAAKTLLVGGVDFGAGGTWSALPGTASEVGALSALAEASGRSADLLTGNAATPAAVTAALTEAGYAHLATHGFFFGGEEVGALARGGGAGAVASTAPPEALSRNPLVESGLALAGANTGPEGTLTAEDILGLDLRGLRLAVLSACDTGRGTEITGQGVLGLQASLLTAGSRALVMSLWPVPDEATAFLMEQFYRGLWSDGLSPAEALAQAQAAVRPRPEWSAPLYWAAWVLAGDALSSAVPRPGHRP